MDFAQILVYILAVVLAIFLILAVVLTVVLIRITIQIKEITTSAQRTVSGVEKIVDNVGGVTSSVGIAKLITRAVKQAKKRASSKKDN